MRTDLLALTEQALVTLANRGLLKRATRDLDAGAGPTVTTDDDGTVRGHFPDGTETVLPQGKDGTCSCAAVGFCRHQLALVLAYQRAHAAPSELVRWSPGELADALEQHVPAGVLTKARRALAAGFPARLHRPTPEQPEPSADLGTCTVRFLVPHDLSYVHVDGTRQDAVALAVLAFREADEKGLTSDDVELDVGGQPTREVRGQGGVAAAVDLATGVLLDGAMHTGTSLAPAFARAERELADLRYPLAALADLADQLAAYRERAAHYRPERVADVVAELHARHRASSNGGATPASRVLGSDEPEETPLNRVRLTGLGCRVTTGAAEVYLADPAGTVLVLRKRWDTDETGAALARRRLGGTTLAALAAGNLVSESAARSASRVVRLVSSRVGKTSVTPSNGTWDTLPSPVLVRDLAMLDKALANLAPRLVRPRVEAEHLRVLVVSEVLDIGYHPGDQRLDAVITDEAGTSAVLSASYRPTAPAALDTIDAALRAGPRFVAGAVRRTRGALVLDPTALVVDTSVVVPDLAPGDGSAALHGATSTPSDPVTIALDAALGVCAEAAHRGLRHLPPDFEQRVAEAVATLRETGLSKASAALHRFAIALGRPEAAVNAWLDAQIRLSTTADAR
ncbi:hypothetical protein [Actinophytocola sp.]|uniref:hypothetical protein n=1 Tax=Actinophytocola sp. TaxID=1872138 RepID=UPI002ED4B6B3